jgi:hypothetical protein
MHTEHLWIRSIQDYNRVALYAVLIKINPKPSLENKAFLAWFVDLPHPPF